MDFENIDIPGVCITQKLNIKIERFNPNPFKDIEDHGDCTIRALCKLYDLSWSEVYKELSDIGLNNGVMNNSMIAIEKFLKERNAELLFSWKYNRGGDPIRLIDIIGDQTFKNGKYFIGIIYPNHCIPMIDNIIYDDISAIDFDSFLECTVDYLYKI